MRLLAPSGAVEMASVVFLGRDNAVKDVKSVSRKQCSIERSDGEYTINSLGLHPTLLIKAKINTKVMLFGARCPKVTITMV